MTQGQVLNPLIEFQRSMVFYTRAGIRVYLHQPLFITIMMIILLSFIAGTMLALDQPLDSLTLLNTTSMTNRMSSHGVNEPAISSAHMLNTMLHQNPYKGVKTWPQVILPVVYCSPFTHNSTVFRFYVSIIVGEYWYLKDRDNLKFPPCIG